MTNAIDKLSEVPDVIKAVIEEVTTNLDEADSRIMLARLADILDTLKEAVKLDQRAIGKPTIRANDLRSERDDYFDMAELMINDMGGDCMSRALMVEACPGCGCMPGDGVTEGCDDPIGCGYEL